MNAPIAQPNARCGPTAVGDVPAWISTALRLIRERANDPARWSARRSDGFRHVAKYSWSEYARRYLELYRQGGAGGGAGGRAGGGAHPGAQETVEMLLKDSRVQT